MLDYMISVEHPTKYQAIQTKKFNGNPGQIPNTGQIYKMLFKDGFPLGALIGRPLYENVTKLWTLSVPPLAPPPRSSVHLGGVLSLKLSLGR